MSTLTRKKMTGSMAGEKAQDEPQPRRLRKGRPSLEESRELDERIKTSALDHFLQFGFDAVSMDTIAAGAGITKRTLYARYKDKASLFQEILSWALIQWRELNLEVKFDEDDHLSLEEELIRAAEVLLERELNIKVVQLARIATAQVDRFPDLLPQEPVRHSMGWSPRLQSIVTILGRHAEKGDVVVHDLELAAELFISLIMGIPARLASFGIYRDKDFERRRIEYAVQLFLDGMRGPAGKPKKIRKRDT